MSGILGGVKMTSYFNLLLKPYNSSASRDTKELFLLATATAELSGLLRVARRFPWEPLHRNPDSDGRWELEECAVLGDAPTGEQQFSTHATVATSSKTCTGGGSVLEGRRRPAKRQLEELRTERLLAKRRERKRKRRKGQGPRKEGKRQRKGFMGIRIPRLRLATMVGQQER